MKSVRVKLINNTLEVPWQVPDGDYAAVGGTLRPATVQELSAYRRELDQADPDKADQVEAAFLDRHIKTWNIVDDQDRPVPKAVASILALPEPLFVRLLPIVAGRQGVELVGKSGSPSSSPGSSPAG